MVLCRWVSEWDPTLWVPPGKGRWGCELLGWEAGKGLWGKLRHRGGGWQPQSSRLEAGSPRLCRAKHGTKCCPGLCPQPVRCWEAWGLQRLLLAALVPPGVQEGARQNAPVPSSSAP